MGITFPHENPPKVYLNVTKHTDNKFLAQTLYHEAQHAFDPNTPVASLNTTAEMTQDLANEAATWRKEIEFAIEKKGKLLRDVQKDNLVVAGAGGKLIPNDAEIYRVLRQGYQGYTTVPRPQRFDLRNYTFQGLTPLNWGAEPYLRIDWPKRKHPFNRDTTPCASR